MFAQEVRYDIDILNDCIGEMQPISDKESYMQALVVERLESMRERNLKEFNEQLREVEYKALHSDASLYDFSKALVKLSRLSKKITKSQMTILKVLDSKGMQ